MDAWSKYTEYFLTRKVCSKRLRIFIFISRSGNSLLYLINNDVLQYKWPMIGQYYYSFYHWPFTIHTGLSLVFVLYDVILFLLATVSCFICLFWIYFCCYGRSIQIFIVWLYFATQPQINWFSNIFTSAQQAALTVHYFYLKYLLLFNW